MNTLRRSSVFFILVLAVPSAPLALAAPRHGGAHAKTTPTPDACPAGELRTPDTAGHCCWPGQAWGGDRCLGKPSSCPAGYHASLEAQACVVPECTGGLVRASDAVHCCWPGQVWADGQQKCVGLAKCPPHSVNTEDGGCFDGFSALESRLQSLSLSEDGIWPVMDIASHEYITDDVTYSNFAFDEAACVLSFHVEDVRRVHNTHDGQNSDFTTTTDTRVPLADVVATPDTGHKGFGERLRFLRPEEHSWDPEHERERGSILPNELNGVDASTAKGLAELLSQASKACQMRTKLK